MKYDAQQINELLNAYIDGELSERKATEVKRLIDHNPELSERLAELQSCKKLAASLPTEKAPDNLADNVIAAMERRMILDELSTPRIQTIGVRRLFMKRFAGVAAILLLVAVLGVIVFQVISPPDAGVVPRHLVVDNKPSEFKIKLTLLTKDIASAKASIDNILRASNGISTFSSDNIDGISYNFSCQQKDGASFFAKLANGSDSIKIDNISIQEDSHSQWTNIAQADINQAVNLITAGSKDERINMATAYAKLDDVKNIEDIVPVQPRFTSGEDRTQDLSLEKTVEIELIIKPN